jgi:hypothetical protein
MGLQTSNRGPVSSAVLPRLCGEVTRVRHGNRSSTHRRRTGDEVGNLRRDRRLSTAGARNPIRASRRAPLVVNGFDGSIARGARLSALRGQDKHTPRADGAFDGAPRCSDATPRCAPRATRSLPLHEPPAVSVTGAWPVTCPAAALPPGLRLSPQPLLHCSGPPAAAIFSEACARTTPHGREPRFPSFRIDLLHHGTNR